MRAEDVIETLELALAAAGLDRVTVAHRPRLLSDNGASYISYDLAEWLDGIGMRYHRQTQGKIERWHQTLKMWIGTVLDPRWASIGTPTFGCLCITAENIFDFRPGLRFSADHGPRSGPINTLFRGLLNSMAKAGQNPHPKTFDVLGRFGHPARMIIG